MGRTPVQCNHSYVAQTPACHRTHLRTARRVWRTVVRATHTPSIRVLPGPQPTAICVTMSSGRGSGAGVMPCAEVATKKAKPAAAINLIIVLLPGLSDQSEAVRCIRIVEHAVEIDQGP